MGNLNLLWDVVSDVGTYSGGSWVAGLPLSNMKTRSPRQVARSTNAATGSTKFVVDLGSMRVIQIFALVNHNLSPGATIRFRASNNSNGSSPLVDVTKLATEPDVPWGSTSFYATPFYGFVGTVPPGGRITFYKHPITVVARYLFVDISDIGNAAGYIQIGRFMAGEPFIPTFNMEWGAEIVLSDESKLTKSMGGQLYVNEQTKRRRLNCSLRFLSEAQGMGAIYDMKMRLGQTRGLLAMWNPEASSSVRYRSTIYGSFADLSSLAADTRSVRFPYSSTLGIEELV